MTVDADDDTRGSVRGPVGTRPWMLLGGALALFLVAILAASVAGRPVLDLGHTKAEPLPSPVPEMTSAGAGIPAEQLENASDVALMLIGIVIALIVGGLLVLALIWLIRRLIAAWQERPLRKQDGVDTDVDVQGADAPGEAEPDAPAIRRGIAAARAAVDTQADPTDAIVAAWLGLEETAVDSGIGRAPSETQVEFTLRMLLRRPDIEEPARDLLRLYEGVRFGGRTASEQERSAAAQALERIEAGWQ